MLLFGFYHDVDLELSWISEHVPASGSTAYDKSLAGAISLMQKQKVPAGLQSFICSSKELRMSFCVSRCIYRLNLRIPCLFVHASPVCVHPGVTGGSDCSPKTPEPHPGEGAEPGQIQQIRRRGSAPEVSSFSYFWVECTFSFASHVTMSCSS